MSKIQGKRHANGIAEQIHDLDRFRGQIHILTLNNSRSHHTANECQGEFCKIHQYKRIHYFGKKRLFAEDPPMSITSHVILKPGNIFIIGPKLVSFPTSVRSVLNTFGLPQSIVFHFTLRSPT